MKLIHSYEATTKLYLDDSFLEPDYNSDPKAKPTYTLPAHATDIQPVGFHTPKWNGKAWIESAIKEATALKQVADYNARNTTTLEAITKLEQSIDTSRMRREVFEGMRKQLAGVSPTAAEAWSIAKVKIVDNEIAILRAKLK